MQKPNRGIIPLQSVLLCKRPFVLVGALAERCCCSPNPSAQQPAKRPFLQAAGLALHFGWVASKITNRPGRLKFHIHAPPLQHALLLVRGAAWKWRRCLSSARGRQNKRCRQQSGYASSHSLPISRMQSDTLPVRSITLSFSLPLCIHRSLFPPHLLLITSPSLDHSFFPLTLYPPNWKASETGELRRTSPLQSQLWACFTQVCHLLCTPVMVEIQSLSSIIKTDERISDIHFLSEERSLGGKILYEFLQEFDI